MTSFLASVPRPALPASFEARISAAIAAEAAARADDRAGRRRRARSGPLTAAAGADDAKDTVRSANPEEFSPAATAGGPSTPARRRPRRGTRASRSAATASRPGWLAAGRRRRRLRMPSMQAASWTLVCVLALAGFGFLVTHSSGSSSSSSADSSSSASRRRPPPGAPSRSRPWDRRRCRLSDAASVPEAGGPTGFLVHSTGTAYQRSTLASQVRDQLASSAASADATPAASRPARRRPPRPPPPARPPRAHPSSAARAVGPAFRVRVAVTGGVAPSLVDKASYDGIPAYIIAVPTEVWVVGRGCTAADTQLIARVPLKG